jgi:hypothetical protein
MNPHIHDSHIFKCWRLLWQTREAWWCSDYGYSYRSGIVSKWVTPGGIQNTLYWCLHLYSSCIAKHRSQQAKLWIPGSTATFCGDCVKRCKYVATNFGENKPGCFTMTTPRLTLPSSPSSFCQNTTLSVIPHPVTSSYFQKWNWSLNDAGSIPLRRSRPDRRECLTLWQKRTSRKRSKSAGDCRSGVYMRQRTTSRVMAADRLYSEFYGFYSVSAEYFGYRHVFWSVCFFRISGLSPEDGNS